MWEPFALLSVTGSLGVLRAMETFETGSDLSTWTHVGYTDGRQIQFDQPSEYEPSILSEFAGFLPHVTSDGFESFPEDYRAEKMVQAAWKSLPNKELELHWESDFWTRFLDPNVSALDMMSKGLKRPMPAPDISGAAGSSDGDVERRVVTKQIGEVKNFLQHVRDVPEKTWKEEREAKWEVAIRRWIALLETWRADASQLVLAVQTQDTFQKKAQILVDIFFNKAPQTILKRAKSLAKLCGLLQQQGITFPCTEEQFYMFLRNEISAKAPSSRLKAYFEALVFSRYVLGVEDLQRVVDSRRCLGASSSNALTCPKQADPFTVEQLCRFHEILKSGAELWDRAMSGMILFCVYGRSRWSDAQHAEELICDRDPEGILQFLEVHTAVHKTARAFHLRHMFLPVAAPSHGVTTDNWGEQWIEVRRLLAIQDLKEFPLMPAPDSNLEPTRRPISTSEAKQWMHHLLGQDLMRPGARLTSHSCKCTCLSYLAKRGAGYEDRLVLGYHSNKLRMTLTYSRDAAARPLAILASVLREIREGKFQPDATRSGRLSTGMAPLDQADLMGVVPTGVSESGPTVNSVSIQSEAATVEAESECEVVSKPSEQLSEQHHAGPEEVDGHVTTDSSDSSGEEMVAWAPIVGHYSVDIPLDKRMWLNTNSKMFHLSHEEHVKFLLCGRRISESFKSHTGQIRFDSAKCRQCFRLKDS